jgi:endo-1,4-beta-xylanase
MGECNEERGMENILKSVLFLASATVMSMAMPQMVSAGPQCGNTQGGDSPNFYTNYVNNGTGCIDTKKGGGNYSTSWSINKEGGNYVAGKGWSTGSPTRKVGYNAGAFSQDGTNWLSLYGWTKGPLIEYYVIDSWSGPRPTFGSRIGEAYGADGGTYEVYKNERKNADNITGTKQDFVQIFSVRTEKATVGENNTITFDKHVKAWEARKEGKKGLGTALGNDWNYQVLSTEANGGGGDGKIVGYSDVTVWEQK